MAMANLNLGSHRFECQRGEWPGRLILSWYQPAIELHTMIGAITQRSVSTGADSRVQIDLLRILVGVPFEDLNLVIRESEVRTPRRLAPESKIVTFNLVLDHDLPPNRRTAMS